MQRKKKATGEKRYGHLLKLEQTLIMEYSTGKRGRFLKMYSDKCQRSSAVDKDIEAESASKSPKKSEYKKKGRPIIFRTRCSKKTPKIFYR
jgi:hypothetical protein